MGHVEKKITQLADYKTFFLSDIGSIQTMINALLLFYSVSSLKLNNSKTVVLTIGKTVTNHKQIYLVYSGGAMKSCHLGYSFLVI